nr:meiotic recombination protein SPO11-1 [Ipomoea batatas]
MLAQENGGKAFWFYALQSVEKIESYCSSGLSNGKEVITLKRESHAHVLLRVLLIVQQLLQENRHGSKRDIYYMHPSIFKEQATVDRAINDICILLQCSRHNLNVVSVGNGEEAILMFPQGGRNPVSLCHAISRLASSASSGFLSSYLLDRFLRLLTEKLRLPAYCLVDCDPYGFDILATYRFGSMGSGGGASHPPPRHSRTPSSLHPPSALPQPPSQHLLRHHRSISAAKTSSLTYVPPPVTQPRNRLPPPLQTSPSTLTAPPSSNASTAASPPPPPQHFHSLPPP